jgi:hypothetical protein
MKGTSCCIRAGWLVKPVGYATDRIDDLSPTPLTAPIDVDGVGDRMRLVSMA